MKVTSSFRKSAEKENLFIQITNKKSQSMPRKILNKQETYKFVDEHYEDLIQKIEKLDQENNKLRELLKKSNYLQFKFVDVSKSDLDFHSLSEIKNKSLDLSLDELKSINQGKSNDLFNSKKTSLTPRHTLAAKQIIQQRQRNNLIASYTQDIIQEQTTMEYQIPEEIIETNYCLQDIYKEMLMNVVTKDMKIFTYMDQIIQQELKQNFITNSQNYQQQKEIMRNLISLLTKMQNYCLGDHPDNLFIMKVYNQLQNLIKEIFNIFEKMKLFMIPLNTIEINYQERIQEIDKLQEQIIQGTNSLQQAQKTISILSQELEIIKIQNQQFQDFFTQISYHLQINDEKSKLKSDLDEVIQKCIDGIIVLQKSEKNIYEQYSNEIFNEYDNDNLSLKLKKIAEKYNKLKIKNNRNKQKFTYCIEQIYQCFPKLLQIDGFESLTIEEQVQIICKTIINQLKH